MEPSSIHPCKPKPGSQTMIFHLQPHPRLSHTQTHTHTNTHTHTFNPSAGPIISIVIHLKSLTQGYSTAPRFLTPPNRPRCLQASSFLGLPWLCSSPIAQEIFYSVNQIVSPPCLMASYCLRKKNKLQSLPANPVDLAPA